MLLELVESFDIDAVREDEHEELVPIRPLLPGVVMKERIHIGTSHLSPLLRLPFSDMREVLKRVLRQGAIQERAAYEKGMDAASCTTTAKEFFLYLKDFITYYLKEKTYDFWMWKLDVDLQQCNLTKEALAGELERLSDVSNMVSVQSYHVFKFKLVNIPRSSCIPLPPRQPLSGEGHVDGRGKQEGLDLSHARGITSAKIAQSGQDCQPGTVFCFHMSSNCMLIESRQYVGCAERCGDR